MNGRRTSGILLHPTSLPGRYGIGELGSEARSFVDFLAETGQGLWQVLPLGPTGYGDSPYQCFSAFAGNPLLVSLELLARDGLLSEADLAAGPAFPASTVDYGAVIPFKRRLLEQAFKAFEKKAVPAPRDAFDAFCHEQAAWLDDFALFMTLKDTHEQRAWPTWERAFRSRDPAALAAVRKKSALEVRFWQFVEYLFFKQWTSLRAYAHDRGVRILGDIPIFVAHDSADVWSHPELFCLAADGTPSFQAGVPPDYFSATGQLWGNPLYRWDVLARNGYAWWIERFRSTLALVDAVRLDHFRGFEAYWEVPGQDQTAMHGRWVKGPGAPLFQVLEAALGKLPIVAENLGVITPEVEALRQRFGWPGMAVLEFAFGTDDCADSFKPHNYTRNLVVYTGTHDNDTIVGWWTGGVGNSTRKPKEVEQERALTMEYLGTEGREIHWTFIRTALASVADAAIIPLQDVLGLGSEARMNLPAHPSGNWRWRYTEEQLTKGVRARLGRLTRIFGRAPERPASGP